MSWPRRVAVPSPQRQGVPLVASLPPSPNPQSPVPVACTFPAHAPAHPESQYVRVSSPSPPSVSSAGTWKNTVHRLDHTHHSHCTSSRSQIHALSGGTYLQQPHEIHWYSPALSSVHPKKERAERHACFLLLFKNRSSSHPRPHLTSSSTSRVYSCVLLKQSHPRPRPGSVSRPVLSCPDLFCPVIVCRPAFWIPSLRLCLGLLSLLADLFD